MNDFNRFLEWKLRQMLDPVVAARPPRRRARQKRTSRAILAVDAPLVLAGEAIAVVEPVVVTVPITAAPQL